MVQTYQSPVWVYKHPFELVMAAYERRFPTCPLMPILVSSEVLSESVSPDGSVRITERLCKLHVDAPFIIRKIAGVDHVSFVQKNRLDRSSRTLSIEVRNMTFANRVEIKEFCRYYVHPENENWTSYEQCAYLDARSFFGLEHIVEKVAIKHYTQNIHTGKKVLEEHIKEIQAEGVSHIPRFVGDRLSNGSALSKEKKDKTVDLVAEEPRLRSRRGSWKRASAKWFQSSAAGKSIPPVDNKLESEYIQRFLGNLTSLEESRLVELRISLAYSHTGKTPNDAHLLRFLRAYDFDVDRARDSVLRSITWRKQHAVDRILSVYMPPSVFASYFPGAWHDHDLEGHPLYVLRLGLLDVKGLLKSVGEEGLVKYVLSVCEEGLRRAEEATKRLGKPISAWTLLVDLESLSVRHLWRPAVRTLLNIIEIVQDNYPETMASLLIARAARVFTVLWTMINPFISEQTSRKIHVLGSSGYEQTLSQFVEDSLIPDFVGGPCPVQMPSGGQIPKSFYSSEFSDALGHGLEQMYTTVQLCKNYYHEVLAPIMQDGAVLTWDFDVVKGVCLFIVLYTEKILTDNASSAFVEKTYHAAPTTGVTSTGLVGSVAITSDLTLAKNREDSCLVEESRTLCREADSFQGSLKCDKLGTYILQWVCMDALGQNQVQLDCPLPMIHTSKCKVVYYCELLDPKKIQDCDVTGCGSSLNAMNLHCTQ